MSLYYIGSYIGLYRMVHALICALHIMMVMPRKFVFVWVHT